MERWGEYPHMDFDTFADSMKQQGFDQVLKRIWTPGTTVEEHTHAFDAKALVVQGEMWHVRAGRPCAALGTVRRRRRHLLGGEP